MPIMRITDAKTWKHLSSREWLTLNDLSEELWFDIPSEPSFEYTDAVEKKEKKEKKSKKAEAEAEVSEEAKPKKKKTKRL